MSDTTKPSNAKMVKILYRHPNKDVRDNNSPKILEWDDQKKERHYFEPETVSGKIVYEVPEAYARQLLSRQPDRYYLLEPKKLLVKFPSADGLSHKMKEVNSVVGTKKFSEFSSEAEAEEKEHKASEKEEKDGEAEAGAKKAEETAGEKEKDEKDRLDKERRDKVRQENEEAAKKSKGNHPVPPAHPPGHGAPPSGPM